MSYATWLPVEFYQTGDTVQYLGQNYLATAPSFNTAPPALPWTPLALAFQPSFGEFISSTTQNLTAGVELPVVNDAKTIGTFDIAPSGPFPTSVMTTATAGTYRIFFSAQVNKTTGGGADDIEIYLRVNGTNVPDTATRIALTQQIEQVLTCEFIQALAAGDSVEIVATTTSGVNCQLLAVPAAPPIPAIPSIVTSITRIS